MKCDGIVPVMAPEERNFAFLQECSNLDAGLYIDTTSRNVDTMANVRAAGNMVLVTAKLGTKLFDPDMVLMRSILPLRQVRSHFERDSNAEKSK